ncbi:MAG TPA: septum formation protein Maf [Aquifex sp.]|nr:septum formation protein Maf [Aquifex sp.]
MPLLMEVILASSSPRRRQILNLIGLKDFKVVPPKGREVKVRKPSDVRKNALLKGESVLKELPKVGKYLVIASDTAVFINGRFLGKPSSPQEAREMLKTLSGNWHTVYTSIGVFLKEGSRVRKKLILDRARVKFKKLSDGEIDWYISTGEPLDKAGAYGIQGYGAIFVEKIVGDYFTVMGMSPNKLYGLLVELLGEGRVLKLLNG